MFPSARPSGVRDNLKNSELFAFMKTDSTTSFFPSGAPKRRKSGMALVIILSCLVLITGVIVAFFASVSTEMNAAKGYSNGVSTKVLADSAVAAVMGTIKTATSGTGVCWASQPGMIRTYGDDGAPDKFFKLYSSDKMTLASTDGYAPGEETLDWKSKTAIFTDLNAPIVSGSLLYPIMDPLLKDVVEGFTITAPPDYDTSAESSVTNNGAPMPVKWLYVLKDGSITAPTAGTKTATWSASDGSTVPSKKNPIVGRIAYWTDDETCKININTASEPTPWDTPRVVSGTGQSDMLYGRYQPAFREYQRFPGHPFTMALSPVLYPNSEKITPEQKNLIYKLIPRVEQGGSQSATSDTMGRLGSGSVTLDKDRLFASVDEFLFKAGGGTSVSLTAPRQVNSEVLTSSTLERLRPFLTANSRAPELTLSGQPRVSIWPVASSTATGCRSVFDGMSAYCATIGDASTLTQGASAVRPFFFQRNVPVNNPTDPTTGPCSTTDDYSNIPRNRDIYKYLADVTGRKVPGFTNDTTTFRSAKKWGNDCDQILTEIFDYIRSTNLHEPDSSLYKYTKWTDSTKKNYYMEDYTTDSERWRPGVGQVCPIKITSPTGVATKGFGRFHTISQVGLMFICKQDGVDGYLTKTANYRAFSDGKPSPLDIQNYFKNVDVPYIGTNQNLIGKKVIQAALLLEAFCPSMGWYRLNNNLFYRITMRNFSVTVTGGSSGNLTVPLFGAVSNSIYRPGTFGWGSYVRQSGGYQGIRSGAGGDPISEPVLIDSTSTGMLLNGGDVTIEIYSGPGQTPTADRLVQTINVSFPTCRMPAPNLVRKSVYYKGGGYDRTNQPITQPTPPRTPIPLPLTYYDFIGNGSGPNSATGDPAHWWYFENWQDYSSWVDPNFGTLPVNMSGRWYGGEGNCYVPGNEYTNPTRRWMTENRSGFAGGCIFREEDVVRTLVPRHGDLRMIAGLQTVSASHWVPSNASRYDDPNAHIEHLFCEAVGPQALYGYSNEPGAEFTENGVTVSGNPTTSEDSQLANYDYHYSKLVPIIKGAGLLYNHWNDFDNGNAQISDGPYINKPDEGNVSQKDALWPAYYEAFFTEPQEVFFSPNRLVPSAMMFGSLPTGVLRGGVNPAGGTFSVHAWETLLFHPPTNRSGNTDETHPGWQSPRDHLIADLFWMPVVEPYPISEPFSTAGKVNMNYQIVPFTYIRRATAMHGALKGEQVLAIPTARTLSGGMSMAKIVKLFTGSTWTENINMGSGQDNSLLPKDACQDLDVKTNWTNLVINNGQDDMRKTIDSPATLKQFDDLFTSGTIFRCATQIAEMHLVRKGERLEDYQNGTFWSGYLATGDNTRERPYANLYAKLTTKSNTFTVHFRVQAVQQVRSPDAAAEKWAQWDEDNDKVLSEYRGSSLIERYVDAADPELAKFDESLTTTEKDKDGNIVKSGSIDPFYRFRVLNVKKFGP